MPCFCFSLFPSVPFWYVWVSHAWGGLAALLNENVREHMGVLAAVQHASLCNPPLSQRGRKELLYAYALLTQTIVLFRFR